MIISFVRPGFKAKMKTLGNDYSYNIPSEYNKPLIETNVIYFPDMILWPL